MSLHEDLSRMLIRLRGPYSREQLGAALGRSRQSVVDLERGGVSLSRLEGLADFYGVDFTIVAIDRRTGRFWNETVAPGLVERIESGAPPFLSVDGTEAGGRRGNFRRRATPAPVPASAPAPVPGATPAESGAESAGELAPHQR